MHMLVIFLVLLSLVFMVMWTLSQSKEKLQQVWSGLAAPFASKNLDWATPIKAWAETSLAKDKVLQAWLLNLPSDGLQALGEKIAEFCVEMNVDLSWLMNPATEVDPAVKQAAEETVIDYCKICLKAVQNQQPAK
jgi:hypothetical protein